MKKIIGGAVLLIFGQFVPLVGPLIIMVGFVLLIWGIVKKGRESGKNVSGGIAPLAKTDDLDVFSITGRVVGIQSRTVINSSTHFSTSGGGGYLYQGTGTVFAPQTYASSSTHSIEVVRYFVKDDIGEISFELNNPPLAVREGHLLSTVYAGNRASSTKGHLVAVTNHDTGKTFVLPDRVGIDHLVKRAMRIPIWLLLIVTAGSFLAESITAFLIACVALVAGLVANYRARSKETLMRDFVAASIRSKTAELLADEQTRKFEAKLQQYEESSTHLTSGN